MTEESLKMSYQIAGMILVCLQMTASQEGMWIQQSPSQIVLAPGEIAWIECKLSTMTTAVYWYKEFQNGSLHGIFLSYEYASAEGKYSSQVNKASNTFSLVIKDTQRNDSGVYYCGLNAYAYPNFGKGTRLIVTDASEPRLSVLGPSTEQDAELPHKVPLLCLVSDFTPSWSILWDTGEEAAEEQMDAGAIDGDGLYSVWSLMTIPSERWKQERNWTCTVKGDSMGRTVSATMAKETEDTREETCDYVFYIGLFCIFILVIVQVMILLFRKRLTRAGRAVQTGNQMPTRQIPETEYAAVRYNK